MVRAVLIGCGAMSQAWLEAARATGTEIAGLVDIDVARARQRAGEFGLGDAVLGSELDTVLAETRPDVVFDVAVPVRAPRDRRDGGRARLPRPDREAAGREPLRTPAPIVAAARDAGRVHGVIQNRRYLAEARRIRRFIASGAIGAPTSIHCDFFVPPHFGGFREEMRHVLLIDMAIHTFDVGPLPGRSPAGRRLLPRVGAEGTRGICRARPPRRSSI